MEPLLGVEPRPSAYKADALPKNEGLAPRAGFEPASSGLKVPHPGPLDERDLVLLGGLEPPARWV